MRNGGKLLQIIPDAPNHRGGVGDYSRQLACRLQEVHGITSTFVSAAATKSSMTADGFKILSPLRDVSRIIDSPSALLLHYVNYGYDPRGVPIWLPSLLCRLQKVCGGRLVTVFHELYATGSWRQSAFWLRPVQMHIARNIAGLSASSIVSSETQRAQLEWLAPGVSALVQPVASNFGEPSFSCAELVKRDPHRWIICGGTELIARSLISFQKNAPFVAAPYSPRELFIVGGAERKKIHVKLGGHDIRTYYYPKIEAKTASAILSTCAFAWIDYFHQPGVPMATVLKSTTFAAFCAHGVIPVFPHSGSPIRLHEDRLPGPFFVTHSEQNLPSEMERALVAQSIYEWYCHNASSFHLAETVASAIGRLA